MNLKKLTTVISLLIVSGFVSAQTDTYYEFLGKVTIHNKKAKGVTIKSFDGDSWFSNYETKANGKFAFYGEAKKYFILQFEKPGYLTKQLIVNTKDIKYSKKGVITYKFDINLMRTKRGQNDNDNISKVDVIEINNRGDEFTYKSNRSKENYLKGGTQMASNQSP